MLPRASAGASVEPRLGRVVSRLARSPGFAFAVAACGAAWLVHRRCSQRVVQVADDVWRDLCQRLGVQEDVAGKWWGRIAGHYGEAGRHYHTLKHVEHMLATQRAHASLVTKPATCQLATFFHDVIYDPRSSTNEEDSALLFNDFVNDVMKANPSGFAAAGDEVRAAACQRVSELRLPCHYAVRCCSAPRAHASVVHARSQVVDPEEVYDYIVKTKSHSAPKQADPNLLLFLDFDMAILGTPWRGETGGGLGGVSCPANVACSESGARVLSQRYVLRLTLRGAAVG